MRLLPVCLGVRVSRSLVFCVGFCRYAGVLQSGRHHHHYQTEFPPKQLLHTVSYKDNRQILNYTVMILKVLEIKR
jgi:hypothetical protein